MTPAASPWPPPPIMALPAPEVSALKSPYDSTTWSTWRHAVVVVWLLVAGFGMQLVVCAVGGAASSRLTVRERMVFLPSCDFVDRIERRVGIDSKWTITMSLERTRFSDSAVIWVFPPVEGVASAADPAYPPLRPGAPEGAHPALVALRTAGWPVRAFDGAKSIARGPQSVPDWSLASIEWRGPTLAFPLLPRPFGLLANTIVFAMAIGGVYVLAGSARRRFRRYRGACTTCSYPCRPRSGVESGSPPLPEAAQRRWCPECGTPL